MDDDIKEYLGKAEKKSRARKRLIANMLEPQTVLAPDFYVDGIFIELEEA